jgi:hypothetical protein
VAFHGNSGRARKKLLQLLPLVLIGGVVAYVLLREGKTEQPPCRRCEKVYSSTSDIIEVTVCDLEKNEQRYYGKVVRLKTLFYRDSGLIQLLDNECAWDLVNVKEDYDSCEGAGRIFDELTGLDSWFDDNGKADVEIIGRLSPIKEVADKKYEFVLLCVERAQPHLGKGAVRE